MAVELKNKRISWSLFLTISVMVAGGIYLETLMGTSSAATAGGDGISESVSEAAFDQSEPLAGDPGIRIQTAFERLALELTAQIEADINQMLTGLPKL